MDLRLRYATRYTTASVGSLIALPLARVAASLVAGDPEWVGHPASCSCYRTLPMLVLVILPLCAVGEVELVRRQRLPWWANVPAMAVVVFLTSVAISVAGFLLTAQPIGQATGFGGAASGVGVLGLQDMFWGSACWSLLRLSDTLLPPAEPEQGESSGASRRDVGVLD